MALGNGEDIYFHSSDQRRQRIERRRDGELAQPVLDGDFPQTGDAGLELVLGVRQKCSNAGRRPVHAIFDDGE